MNRAPIKRASVWGFDVDGTLFLDPVHGRDSQASRASGTAFDFNQPHSVARLQPIRAAISAAQALASRKTTDGLVYISGRTTAVQVELEALLARHRLHGPVVLQDRWRGHDAMARFKAAALIQHGASYYVGDQPADAEAARLARVVFIHADTWAQHGTRAGGA